MTQGRTEYHSALREGREGIQLERTCRALCYVLDGWCGYEGERKECPGEPTRGCLRAIYFDKLAMAVFRVWDQCFRESGVAANAALSSTPPDTNKLVNHPCPLTETKGKHGRGLSRRDPRNDPRREAPLFVLEMLYQLQEEGILHYFQISPPDSSPRDYRTTVKAGYEVTNRDDFLASFGNLEVDILKELEGAFRHLGPSQIRALGTHESAFKTAEDIQKEFDDPERDGLWDQLLNSFLSGHDWSATAAALAEYSDEACRKSFRNRAEYTEGRTIVANELRTPILRNAFLRIQSPSEEIWDNDRIKEQANLARVFEALTSYLQSTAFFSATSDPTKAARSPEGTRKVELLQDSSNLLSAWSKKSVPDQILALLGTGSTIQQPVRDRLIELVRTVRGSL